MRCMSWACAFAFAGSLFIGSAHAQGLRQPLSVRPAAFNYEHYLQDEVASPSDAAAAAESVVVEEAPADPESAPAAEAPAAAAPAASSGCNSCSTCAPSCCTPCCNTGCGCGGGLGEAFSLSDSLLGSCSPWTIGGWVQAGHHNKANNGNLPAFNNHPTNFNLHQGWFFVEKAAAPTNGDIDWGLRADIMYGVDGADTQAFGNTQDANNLARGYDTGWNHGIYGWALPQLYGEIAGDGWSVKAGHFYTLVGYEVVQAPQNFFYSHSYTQYNSEPFTHTGVLATYQLNDWIESYAGWTLGWDTGFDQFGDGNAWLGGFKATLSDDISVTYISTIGNFGARGDDGYMSSVVVNTALTSDIDYIFQSDFLRVDGTGEDTFGINQYLIYNVSDTLGLGTRMEWYKTDFFATNNSTSAYEWTIGANVRPHANFTVRPELRQEWVPGLNYDQTIFGVDAYVTY
ncbi:MAG: porin [Planctomycetales bacterium]|nr:porin [Planctomycetales bacterium]